MQNLKPKTQNIKKHSKNVFSKLLSRFPSKLARGFSLIELLVVMSIMVVITSVTLFRQAKFSSDILITNMAYEIALSIREVEVLGTSSRGNESTGAYKSGYGVHFALGQNGTKPNSYFEFIDTPIDSVLAGPGVDSTFNYFYDGDSIDPHVGDDIVMSQGDIVRFCGKRTGLTYMYCVSDITGYPKMTMDIVFVKPNPEAHISMSRADGVKDTYTYSEAIIVVESALGDKCRTVRVFSSGQVAVDPVSDTSNGCDVIQ